MAAQCWLHPEGEEHDALLLVGVRHGDGRVVPADTRCAREFPEDLRVPATEINVEVIRS